VSKRYSEILFTLVLIGTVAAAVYSARGWEIKARLFPWSIGIPLLVMLIAILAFEILSLRRAPAGEAPASSGSLAQVAAADEDEAQPGLTVADATLERRRGLSIVGWLLGFLAAIWLLGFTVGGILTTLAYLKIAAKERWPISLAISAGTALFFWLMINQLQTPFPDGKLFETLGIDQDWSGPLAIVLTPLSIVWRLLDRRATPSVPPPSPSEA
jgi:hypothetical protein